MNLRNPAKSHLFNSAALCSIEAESDLSLTDALSAAFDADTGSGGAPADVAPAPDKAPETPALAADPARDATGKFAKAPAAPDAPIAVAQGVVPPAIIPDPTAQQAPAAPADAPTIRIPPGLSPATKAEFDKLPQHVREDFARLQGDVETAKTTWDQKAQGYNRLDSLLAPARDFYHMRGFDDAARLQRLVVAEDMLEKKPYEAIAALAQQVGVDLRRLIPGDGGQQQLLQQQQQPLHPAFQQMASEINTLKSAQAAAEQQRTQAAQSEISSKIEAFKTDPKNLYFENVKNDMGALISSGAATDLQDAYDKAIWASPTIRPLLLQAQQQQVAAQAEQAARAHADAARHASGSITGSPAPGSAPAAQAPANVRDALSAAWDAAA